MVQAVNCLSRVLVAATAGLLVASVSTQAQAAAPTYYDDLTDFEAAIQFSVTDDYSDPAYVFIQNDAIMSAVIGETDYMSTGFDNLNIVSGGYYCSGCNGSFELSFMTTSVGDATGVYGAGAHIQIHNMATPYFAFITFGDGTTENVALPAAGSWWGVSAPERIETIHFGLSMGGTTTGGSFGIDNLIAAEGETDCGDGVLNKDEDCDDAGESAMCNANCTFASCGDDITNMAAGEDCDDEGESAECDADCTAVVCGDTTINISAGEECDDAAETADCDIDCTLADCGDGDINVTAGEVCDGNGMGAGGVTPTCDPDCTEVECGDSILNLMAGEICDEGGETNFCNADCTESVCGDGILNVASFEECDDGNDLNDDGCAANCTIETDSTSSDSGGSGSTGAASGGVDGSSGGVTSGLDTSGGGGGEGDESGNDTTDTSVDPVSDTGTGTGGGDDLGSTDPETGCNCTSGDNGGMPAGLLFTLFGLVGLRRRARNK